MVKQKQNLGFLFLMSIAMSLNALLALLLAARPPLGLNKYIANNIPGGSR